MNYDYGALLAALVAFCVTLLAFFLLPALDDQPPGLALAALHGGFFCRLCERREAPR